MLAELQGKQMPTEYELSRTKHENEGLRSRVAWLEAELQSKSNSELVRTFLPDWIINHTQV